jgi:hypothetical protein
MLCTYIIYLINSVDVLSLIVPLHLKLASYLVTPVADKTLRMKNGGHKK